MMECTRWMQCGGEATAANLKLIQSLAPCDKLKIHLLTSTILQLIVIAANGFCACFCLSTDEITILTQNDDALAVKEWTENSKRRVPN